MKYLLINHVPFGAGNSPGTFRVGDLFLQDLCAQANAIRRAGGELIIATPLVQNLDAMSGVIGAILGVPVLGACKAI